MSPAIEPPHAPARGLIFATMARALRPRKALKVSDWADKERRLSSKGSAEPGRWRTERNPPLREPMDCFSSRSPVRDAVLMFPIQFGKTEVAINTVGYTMDHNPGPIMVCLPGEVSMNKWVAQKLNPMIDETPVVKATLASVASRDSANTRTFKDYQGGQLYLEHAGSPSRLKSTSVRTLIVDELDEFAGNLIGGDDPVEMLNGRTSAFPATYKRLYISTPQIKGLSRIDYLWGKSDQRRYHIACPHCAEPQPLEWSGLHWSAHAHQQHGRQVWYACRECGATIDEHHKTRMIAAGAWIPANPGARLRGYHINALYYPIGLGPRWADLVEMWLDAQGDPAKLKTFVNDRLAEPWEDPAMRSVKHNLIADRAETYALRTAPAGVLCVTAGVDTQDNRLAVHITGWGRGLAFWALDYVELPGDPAQETVWTALTELLTRPILHASGATLTVQAVAIDAGGHRTEAVKAYVRDRRVRRPLCIFGAVPNNAPVLSKGKLHDVDWKGRVDKRGVQIHHVGTVAVKHWLYGRLSTDADIDAKHLEAIGQEESAARAAGRPMVMPEPQPRLCHFTDQLPEGYFPGLVSETYNPAKNRFEKRRGARNEPLDTWVYSFAAAHHPELRLHRATKAEWDKREAELLARTPKALAHPSTDPIDGHAEPAAQVQTSEQAAPKRFWHDYSGRNKQRVTRG
jgi:phage terminase large subunit GpA-like protein